VEVVANTLLEAAGHIEAEMASGAAEDRSQPEYSGKEGEGEGSVLLVVGRA
jgi:hypothetical protein